MAVFSFIDIPYSIRRPGRAKRGAMFRRRSELEKVLAVAEAEKIVAAGHRLGITQPALIRAIARLENRFGAPLFERLPTSVRPTALGAEAAAQARRLLHAFEEAEDRIAGALAGRSGCIRATADALWMQAVLPQAVGCFRNNCAPIRAMPVTPRGLVGPRSPEPLANIAKTRRGVVTTSTLYYFVDTNLFIQCHPLQQLDWSPWQGFEEVGLIVSSPVQHEIDRLKTRGGRVGKRARAASAMFREMLGETHKLVHAQSPRVVLSVEPRHTPAPDLAGRLNYQERDHQLLGSQARSDRSVRSGGLM